MTWRIGPRRHAHSLLFHNDERVQRACPDALVQCGRLRRRLHAEFVGQDAAAALVLRQRRAAFAAEGEPAHQLAMGLLTPGVERELLPGGAAGLGVSPAPPWSGL